MRKPRPKDLISGNKTIGKDGKPYSKPEVQNQFNSITF